jgi:hypothetical protein
MPRNTPQVSALEVERYETLSPLLKGLYRDVKELAARKQDGVLAKQMIIMINRILKDLKEFLKNEPTFQYLDLLDEAMIPKNSDALVLLGQFNSAMERYYKKYTSPEEYGDDDARNWNIKGRKTQEQA